MAVASFGSSLTVWINLLTHTSLCTLLVFVRLYVFASSADTFSNSTTSQLSTESTRTSIGGNSSLCLIPQNWQKPVYTPCNSMCSVPSDGGDQTFHTACSCSSLFQSVASVSGTILVSTYPVIGPFNQTLDTLTTASITDSAYKAPDNCCQVCWITAQSVQILFWPITASQSSQNTTLITEAPTILGQVSAGTTFISPSVYVAYHNLGAIAECPPFPVVTRGTVYDTIIAYAFDELSTSQNNGENLPMDAKVPGTPINFTEYQLTPPKYKPSLSLPAGLSAVDPAWGTCLPLLYGALDPPRLLAQATILTSNNEGTQSSLSATPGATIGSAYDPATITSTPGDPTTSNMNGGFPEASAQPGQTVDPGTSYSTGIPAGSASKVATTQSPKGAQDPTTYNDVTSIFSGGHEVQTTATSNGIADGNSIRLSHSIIPDGAPTIVGDSHVLLESDTHVVTSAHSTPPIIADSHTSVRAPTGGVILTTGLGSEAVVSDYTATGDFAQLIVDGKTYPVPSHPAPHLVLLEGHPILRASLGGGISFASFALALGSQTTLSEHVISAATSSVVLDGAAYPLPTQAGATLQYISRTQSEAIITLANGAVVSAGGPTVVVDGTTYAVPPSGIESIVDGKTASFSTSSQAESVLTVAGKTFAVNPSGILVNGQTLSRGGAALTISATVISWGSDGLQVGSSPFPLSTARETEQVGLGPLIMSALANGPSETTTTGLGGTAGSTNVSTLGVAAFTGDGRRSVVGFNCITRFYLGVMTIMLVLW